MSGGTLRLTTGAKSNVVISLAGAATGPTGAIAIIMARSVFNLPIDQTPPILEEG